MSNETKTNTSPMLLPLKDPPKPLSIVNPNTIVATSLHHHRTSLMQKRKHKATDEVRNKIKVQEYTIFYSFIEAFPKV